VKCFYHHDRDAVGFCKVCCKGLCPECAADIVEGLVCRNRCEDQARATMAFWEHSTRSAVSPAQRQVLIGVGIFNIGLGVAFLVWGQLSDPPQLIVEILGILFLAFGVFITLRAWQIPRFPGAKPTGGTSGSD
jgi:hypothetical protein